MISLLVLCQILIVIVIVIESSKLSDVVEELTNHGDEHQQRSEHFFANSQRLYANSNHLFTNNDVQSMDAIERRDFINEQKATANRLLGGSSLIINGTNGDEPRLNVELLGNSFSQKMEQKVALTEEQITKRNNENVTKTTTENGAQSSNDQLITTPTTSRTKRSRMPFATGEKSTLARSLEKSNNDADKGSTSNWDATHRESPEQDPMALLDASEPSSLCNCTTNDADDQQSTSKANCSDCNKERIGFDDASKADELDDNLEDEIILNEDEEEKGESSSQARK